jgi:hypothetical protein
MDSINSFHYFDNNKEESWEVELERANSSSMFPYQFNKVFDYQLAKKHSLDLSDIEEQYAFVDRLNISEIKPLQSDSKNAS